ncbi:MAG: signal peptidase II [candidate division WOR-3 bacterium]
MKRPFVWAAIGALFLDQLTKVWVYGTVAEGESVRLIGSVLSVSNRQNPHGVFGWVYGPAVVYLVLPIAGSLLVLWFALRARSNWLSFVYGMILGGALGNVIDRIRLGHVIDFIDVEIRALKFRWFTFNLADAFLVVGVILLVAFELFRKKPGPERPAAQVEEGEPEQKQA